MEKRGKYLIFFIGFLVIALFSASLVFFQLKTTLLSSSYIERAVGEEKVCEILSFNYDYFSNQVISSMNQPFFSAANIQNAMFSAFPANFIKKEISTTSLLMEDYIYDKNTALPTVDLTDNKEVFKNQLIQSSSYPNKEIVFIAAAEITKIIPDEIKLADSTISFLDKYKPFFLTANHLLIFSIPLILALVGLISVMIVKHSNLSFASSMGLSLITLAFWCGLLTLIISKSLRVISALITSSLSLPSFVMDGVVLPIINHLDLTIVQITVPIFGSLFLAGTLFIAIPYIKSTKAKPTIKEVKPFKRKHKLFEG